MANESAFFTSPQPVAQHHSPQAGSDDLQRLPRKPFNCIRRIAVWERPGFPPEDAFHPVQCQDLSTEGISFVYINPPCFSRCVIELVANERFLCAELAHVSPTAHEHLCVVRCEFKGRVLDRKD